jgi:hypothetical protein
VLLALVSLAAQGQLRVIKPIVTHPATTKMGIGAGITRSVVYLNRNVKENNDATGFNVNMVYGGAKLVRVAVDYTYYKAIDIAPTWYNVQAHTLEANLHFLARFKSSKAVFFPLFGLSYNIFSGFFTGQSDNLNLASIYPKRRQVSTEWLGVNIGTGYEYYFKPGSFFIDYTMRVGLSEGTEQLNIMDVCFFAGLRYNLRVPSIYRIFKGTRGRYSLDIDGADW